MSTEIKFEVQQGWGDFKIVWMMKREGDKLFNGYMKMGNIEWEEVKEGLINDLTPFLKVPGWTGIDFQPLIDALSQKAPSTKETATTAELRATKYHLEDMRKLVKGLS